MFFDGSLNSDLCVLERGTDVAFQYGSFEHVFVIKYPESVTGSASRTFKSPLKFTFNEQ